MCRSRRQFAVLVAAVSRPSHEPPLPIEERPETAICCFDANHRARAQSRRSVDASDYRARHDRSTVDHAAIPPAGSGPLSYSRCAVYARTSRETEAEPIYSSIEAQRDACYAHLHKPQSLGQPSVLPSSAPPPRPTGMPAWRDTDLRLQGPVVAELQKLFLVYGRFDQPGLAQLRSQPRTRCGRVGSRFWPATAGRVRRRPDGLRGHYASAVAQTSVAPSAQGGFCPPLGLLVVSPDHHQRWSQSRPTDTDRAAFRSAPAVDGRSRTGGGGRSCTTQTGSCGACLAMCTKLDARQLGWIRQA
jgi:hypothetical protein